MVLVSIILITCEVSLLSLTSNTPPVGHLNNIANQQYTNIMPLGDSITFGYGGANTTKNGYREELWFNLRDHSNITPNFVGHCGGGPIGPGVNNCLPENPYTVNSKMGDWNHEGHSGWKTDQLTQIAAERIKAHQTRYVLLLTGANDLRLDTSVAEFKQNLSKLLDSIQLMSPTVHVFVGTPTFKNGEPDWDDYVWATRDVVQSKINSSLVPTHIIGQRNGILHSGELFDGVHPTVCGYSRLRYVWMYYMARSPLLNSSGIPWTIPNYPFNSPPVGSCKGIA